MYERWVLNLDLQIIDLAQLPPKRLFDMFASFLSLLAYLGHILDDELSLLCSLLFEIFGRFCFQFWLLG